VRGNAGLTIVLGVVMVALLGLAELALASPATGSRTLPASVESGAIFDVTIEVSGCGAFGQVVEYLPQGFGYVGCETCGDDVMVSREGNAVKFTFIGDSVTFEYSARAPTVDAVTTYTFRGVVKDEDKNEYPLGDSVITVTPGGSSSQVYTLTLVVRGEGSTVPEEGRHSYQAGEVIRIRAFADPGWEFDHWDGDVADPDSSSTTVVMDRDKTVVANFVELPAEVYELAVSCEPDEGGSVVLDPPSQNRYYQVNTLVKLTALAAPGYSFRGWSGDVSGSENPVYVMMNSRKQITASFTPSAATSAQEGPLYSISPLNISPLQAKPNEEVIISISVTNSGTAAGSYQAVLYINQELEASKVINVLPGSSEEVVFTVTRALPGTYMVSLAGQEGQFIIVDEGVTVANQGAIFRSMDSGILIAVLVILSLAAAVVFALKRIRKEI
jgi:hypothetical protein